MTSPEAFEQMVADPQRVGHDRQRRVHRRARRKEAAVDDVQVVDMMRAAVGVEHRRRGVRAETQRTVLVRDARKRNPARDVRLQRYEVLLELDAAKDLPELAAELPVRILVAGGV